MKKKNNNWTTVFLVLLLLAGVSLLLYPSLSDYWNSMHQTRAIASYAETVSQLDTAQYDEMWKAAQDYNRSLAQRETAFALTDEQKAAYESLLDVSGLGVMGYPMARHLTQKGGHDLAVRDRGPGQADDAHESAVDVGEDEVVLAAGQR